ncbi:MAG: methyltransferase domain-containing protein [bacterium]|nr:methyltransferase domain-containing protein [bacterium]
MNAKDNKINWSDECWREKLEAPRKYLWREDTLDMLARWMGLHPGMTAVDVGCGLGYLGFTYWRYFGEGGAYFGVDENSELLSDARVAAGDWALGGTARFLKGDAYYLPFPDGFADWTMCQTLLMHLEKPEETLAEMVRITKPGGLILCKEPDNLSSRLELGYSSLPDVNLEDDILDLKIALLCYRGRIKLGLGDEAIGTKLPLMMKRLDLVDVDARINDRVYRLEPPYQEPEQEHRLKQILKAIEKHDENREYWIERGREMYVAAGGNPEDVDEAAALGDENILVVEKQIKEMEYYACGSGPFYVVKGMKPE